jgi:hypothetical protein
MAMVGLIEGQSALTTCSELQLNASALEALIRLDTVLKMKELEGELLPVALNEDVYEYFKQLLVQRRADLA